MAMFSRGRDTAVTTRASDHARTWLYALAIAFIAFGFRLINVRDLPNDHYMHLAWAQQLLFGELPGRDFVDPGMPLTYLLSALVQGVSPGPFSEAVLCCVMIGIAAAVTFVVSAELTGSRVAGVAAAVLEIALYPRLYSYPKVLVPAVALLLIQQYVRRPGGLPLVLMAIWTAIALLLRHDLGVYAAAGFGAALLWIHWQRWGDLARAFVAYAAAVIVASIPYMVFVQWSEGSLEHFHEAVEFARGEAHQRFLAPPAFPFVSVSGTSTAWSAEDSAVLLFYSAHLVAVAALVLLATSKNARRTANPLQRSTEPVAAAALAMFVLYLLVVLRHPIVSRIQDVATLLTILGVWDLAETRRRAADARVVGSVAARLVTAFAFGITVAVAAASAASVWNLGSLTERLRDTRIADGPSVMWRTIEGVHETGTQWPWERFWPAGELPEAVRYLNACTAPDDTVLLTWAAPEYYFFAKRRFAAGHALFLPPESFTTRHDQELMLARMRRQRPPIVLINETRRNEFATAYGEVDRYLRQKYVPSGHFAIREGSDVIIAMHRDLKPERTYGAERWPCGFDNRAASRTASTAGYSRPATLVAGVQPSSIASPSMTRVTRATVPATRAGSAHRSRMTRAIVRSRPIPDSTAPIRTLPAH